MPAQSLDNQILHYLPLLEQDQKKSILTVIKSFMKSKEDAYTRPTIEEYNKEIDEAVDRVKNGEFYTHEEVVEMSKKW